MKKFITKSKLLFIAIFSFVSLHNYAQNTTQTLQFGREQYQDGNFANCIAALSRVEFFDRSALHTQDYEMLANSYFNSSDIDKATTYFNAAATSSANDSLRYNYFFKVIFCQIIANKYQESLITLYNLPDVLPDVFVQKRDFYLGLVHYQLGQYDESQQSFKKYFNANNQQFIDSLFAHNARLDKRYNPKKARLMSMIVPGLGQVYCGDFKSGLNSLILTAAVAAMGVNYMLKYTFIDSLASVAPWYQRYYFGGFNKAYAIAEQKIFDERRKILGQIFARANQ